MSPKFYHGKELLVLQWIRPKADMGVHALDILTINSSDEGFKVINVILWTDCIGPSSHNTTAGYQEWGFQGHKTKLDGLKTYFQVDVNTEIITAATPWYCPYLTNQKTTLVGTNVPGVKKACKIALKAHREKVTEFG